MSETKQCPFCSETILAEARKCRYCGAMLDGQAFNSVPPIQQVPPQPPVYPGYAVPQQPMYGTQQGSYMPHPEQRMRACPEYKPSAFKTLQYVLIGLVLLYFLCMVTAVICMISAGVTGWRELANAAAIFSLITMALGLVIMPVFIIFHYRCWNIIQDGYAQTTPGKAVGFLFIPFFNLYWMFVSFYGLTVDLNSYLKRYGINAKYCSEGVAMTMCILNLVFPCISPIFLVLYLNSVSRVAAAIQKAKMEQTH